jgi:pantoate kinase
MEEFHAISLVKFRNGATAYLRSLNDHTLAKDVVEYTSEVMHNIGLDDVVRAFGGAVFREGQGQPGANAQNRARRNFMDAEGM